MYPLFCSPTRPFIAFKARQLKVKKIPPVIILVCIINSTRSNFAAVRTPSYSDVGLSTS
eukprot:SAG11_NODE_18116_length_499_cov_1.412500_1_plen_58_part_10